MFRLKSHYWNTMTIITIGSLLLLCSCGSSKESMRNAVDKKTDEIETEVKVPKSNKPAVIQEVVYVATNKVEGNSVVGFARMSNGIFRALGEFHTGGKGTGNVEIFDWGYDVTHPLKDGVDPLISAYGIFKTDDNNHILVVNPGDGSISSFNILPNRKLQLSDTKPAGDVHPLSIASYKDIVYVASAGTSKTPTPPFTGNLLGYKIGSSGKLTAIANSKRDLNARPSCVAFTPDGKFLVVNELVTGLVKVFGVHDDGLISEKPISQMACPHDAANGRWLAIPVGFDIVTKNGKNIVLVSEARFLDNTGNLRPEANVVPQSPLYSWQTGSTSSFMINDDGQISLMSGDVYTGDAAEGGEIANCWVDASHDGNTLYAANALSSSLSTYDIHDNGSITIKDVRAYKDSSESLFFGDLTLSKDGKSMYQLIGNQGSVLYMDILSDGTLRRKEIITSQRIPAVGSFGIILVD